MGAIHSQVVEVVGVEVTNAHFEEFVGRGIFEAGDEGGQIDGGGEGLVEAEEVVAVADYVDVGGGGVDFEVGGVGGGAHFCTC